jgi:hypothetical protein
MSYEFFDTLIALGQVVYGNEEIYPKPCVFFRAQEIFSTFSNEQIVAL